MIYICKACEGGCSGCGKACGECGKCCGNGCDGIGKCVGTACDGLMNCLGGLCTPCATVMDRPLGGYVMLTSFICLPAALCSGLALSEPAVTSCGNGSGLNAGNLALALLHVFMALYLQTRLFHGLQQQRELPLAANPDVVAPPADATILMEKAGKIVLYDVLFCLYTFVIVGSFVLQFVVITWAVNCGGSTGASMAAACFMLFFHVMSGCFLSCWTLGMLCGDCCSRCPGSGVMGFLFGGRQSRPTGPTVLQGAPAFAGQPVPGMPPPGVAPVPATMASPSAPLASA